MISLTIISLAVLCVGAIQASTIDDLKTAIHACEDNFDLYRQQREAALLITRAGNRLRLNEYLELIKEMVTASNIPCLALVIDALRNIESKLHKLTSDIDESYLTNMTTLVSHKIDVYNEQRDFAENLSTENSNCADSDCHDAVQNKMDDFLRKLCDRSLYSELDSLIHITTTCSTDGVDGLLFEVLTSIGPIIGSPDCKTTDV